MEWSDASPTVATVLEPTERPRLEAAAHGSFAAVHTDTVSDLIRMVRERPIRAVLVSPRLVPREDLAGVAALVRQFPGVPTVAVVSEHDALSSERLLALGASGVRRIVDVTERDGWRHLRELVTYPVSPTAARILTQLIPALGEPTEDCRRFFELIVRRSPTLPSVRSLTRELRVRPSTFMSRFFRAGVASPKRYLTSTRLLYAAELFQTSGLSIADVAYRLDYSSPQSFGRHVRAIAGITAGEFRRRRTFEGALEDYIVRLILPYRATFRTFHPLEHGVAGFGHRW